MSSNKTTTSETSPATLPPGVVACNLDDRGDHSGDLLTLLIARLEDLLRPQGPGKLK